MKFTKNTVKGFTLIELMVVITIISILSAVISAPIQTYLKKSRDTKKIADIYQIKSALDRYAADNNGVYPASIITNTGTFFPDYLKVSPANAALGTLPRDKYMYVTYADASGNIIGYHLGVALEYYNQALLQDDDCGNTAGSAKLCTSGGAVSTINNTNYGGNGGSGNPIAGSTATDFGGSGTSELINGICSNTSLTTCIYDVSQQ